MSRNVSVARKAKLSPKSKKFEKIRAKGNLEIFNDPICSVIKNKKMQDELQDDL